MLKFDLYNHTRKTFSKKLFEKLLKNSSAVLIKEKKMGRGQKLFVELNLVGNSAITRINRTYRRKNQPTDVISLSYFHGVLKSAFTERETLGSLKNKPFCRYQKHLIFGSASFAPEHVSRTSFCFVLARD